MENQEGSARSLPAKGRLSISRGRFGSIRSFWLRIRLWWGRRLSRSNRVLAPRGTRTPLGQTLLITAGCGWTQKEGGTVEEIRAGDVVWFAPHEKHWHGATPTTAMTHIAIQERKEEGKFVEWMEQVSEEQYRR